MEKIGYEYDANGNRTKMDRLNVTPKLPQPIQVAYNTANQMTSFNGYPLTYDANGNLLTQTRSCGVTNYAWNARNQLIGIDGFNADCSPLTASFKYDALGRRIEKTIDGRTIQYLYDGLDIVQEIENGTVTANYMKTLSIDEPLARIKTDGTVRFYQQDALGTVMALIDETGAIKTQYNYDPFGNTEVVGEASDNPLQYTGRENDVPGLYYYRARYYSPELQRFISEDPIGFEGGINFYAYVGNNPTMFVDPLGLKIIGPLPSNPQTVDLLNKLDEFVGDNDIYITEGDRPKDASYGAPDSYHKHGQAADIYIPGFSSEQTAEKASEVGFDGIGTYDKKHGGHTHVDTRGYEWNGHNGRTLRSLPSWRKSKAQKHCP